MADTAMSSAAGGSEPAIGRGLKGLLLVAIPVFLVGWLIIYPIIAAILSTLFVAGPDGVHVSTASYQFFFSDPYSRANLALTLWTTGVCAVLLLLTGLPIALYLRFSTSRFADLVQSLAIFPMFVPSIILSYALIRTIGPNGTVDILLNAVGLPKLPTPYLTPWGPVIGLVWDNLPLTVLMLTAGLRAFPTPPSKQRAMWAPVRSASSGTSSCRAWAIPFWSRSPSRCSASSPPSPCLTCWVPPRRK